MSDSSYVTFKKGFSAFSASSIVCVGLFVLFPLSYSSKKETQSFVLETTITGSLDLVTITQLSVLRKYPNSSNPVTLKKLVWVETFV